jgi:methionyl aminopeptidase
MRVAGRLAAEVLDMIGPHVKAGVTTGELDRICHDYIVNVQQAIPAPLNYKGFPKSICTSVNHVVCHGIPSDSKGPQGWRHHQYRCHRDQGRLLRRHQQNVSWWARVPVLAERLIKVTQECLYKSLALVKPGCAWRYRQRHPEARGIQPFQRGAGFCGHGIGKVFHEEPQILHYGRAGTGMELKAGMTFTIEPMINAGSYHTKVLPDGWTAVTKDHKLSAQWEHTMLVTETGVEVLTARREEDLAFCKPDPSPCLPHDECRWIPRLFDPTRLDTGEIPASHAYRDGPCVTRASNCSDRFRQRRLTSGNWSASVPGHGSISWRTPGPPSPLATQPTSPAGRGRLRPRRTASGLRY